MIDLRGLMLGSILTAFLIGCGASNGGVPIPQARLQPASRSNQERPRSEHPGVVTIEAIDSTAVSAYAYVDGVEHKPLPYTFQPPFSRQPYSVVIAATFPGGHRSATYAFQQSSAPTLLYFNPFRDAEGPMGTIEPARAFAKRPSGARVTRAPLGGSVGPSIVPDEVYVTYDRRALDRRGESAQALEARTGVARYGVDMLSPDENRILRMIVLNERVPRARAIAALRAMPAVKAVDPVHYARMQGDVAPVYPNNPGYLKGDQWYLSAIDMPHAWGVTRGQSSVQVAIIDTGVDRFNEGLAGKLVSGESVLGGIVTQGLIASQDYAGHGTHVAGIAAAATNTGVGFAGTGFDVTIRAYRVAPYAGDTSLADVALALQDAVADGCRVANLSLSTRSPAPDVGLADAIAVVLKKGLVVVSSSGNDALPTVAFPGSLPGVISVGASALNDQAKPAYEYVASYSNYGPTLTLVAPGGDGNPFGPPLTPNHGIDNLATTTPNGSAPCAQDPKATSGCGYRISQGTSMSVPVVVGIAALMLSVNPALTPAEVKSTLQQTADDINDPREGSGRVDGYRAVAAAAGLPAPVTPSPHNFVAIAYTVAAGSNRPHSIERTYPAGVRVGSNGVFRLPDIAPSPEAYSIGLWYDANGDGIVDKGDWFGSVACSQPVNRRPTCNVGGIPVKPVPAGFTLR